MSYDVSHLVTLGQAKEISTVFKTGLDTAFKSLSVTGRKISFFGTEDASGTALATLDLPKDLFLDLVKTKFEQSFTFNAETYPGATDPSLNGKPVFVLAVKGSSDPANGAADDTVSYSFLDMSKLVDTYTAKAGDSAKILNISGYEIEFKISADVNNALKVNDDGLCVPTATMPEVREMLTELGYTVPQTQNGD